jgi:precorrin-2 dehydrogenase/sirohydrochlorin ferrochelatase
MSYLVNLVVQGRPAVVIGGGAVAARKIAALVEAQADVTVVAPQICDAVRDLELGGHIRVERRCYAPGDTRAAFVVVAATDNNAVNSQVAEEARAGGALVNVVDRPALCTFTVPAIVRRGDLTLAVATGGRCPSLARAIREQLDHLYGFEYAEAAVRLGDLREHLIAAGWTAPRIQAAVSALMDNGLIEAIASKDEARLASLFSGVVGDVGTSAVGHTR